MKFPTAFPNSYGMAVTVLGLTVGNHTVSFSTVGGWTAPANQSISVSANSTATATGVYTAAVQAQCFNYTTNNGTITITGYTCSDGAVTIPDTINGYPVTSIEDDAFGQCYSVASVTIPSSVTNIGDYTFGECYNLTAITVDPSNPAYSSVAGVLFDKSQTTLIQYPPGKAGTPYTIPNSVTSIGDGAFVNSRLTSVTIPNSVTSIGDDAFEWGSLASVTIPSSVTNIGDYAFYACALTAITVDPSNPAYSSVAGVLFNKNQTTLIQCLFRNVPAVFH